MDIDFDEEFGLLNKKMNYRFRIAFNNVDPMLRRISFSTNRVEGVKKGTVLKATDSMSNDIFSSSQIILYEYEVGG